MTNDFETDPYNLEMPVPHITPAHLHVLINHIPIIGLPIILLLLAWGLLRREDAVVRAALIGTVLLAVGTWFTDYTGDGAKDDIRHLAWANKAVITAHEDAGDQAEMVAIATGVVALATLVLARGGRPMRRPLLFAVLVLLIGSSALAARAGWRGGKIRHNEFGLTPAASPDSTAPR
jgi:hypothetical protein